MNDDTFANLISHSQNHEAIHWRYSAWLQKHGHNDRAACLLAWLEVLKLPYDDGSFQLLRSAVEQYQQQIQIVDRNWLEQLARVRYWVDADTAEKVARLYLRLRQGRKLDRQWIGSVITGTTTDRWEVRYWRASPHRATANFWRDTIPLSVDAITAAVTPVRATP